MAYVPQSKEQFVAITAKQAAVYREMCEAAIVVQQVCEQFNGKVINVRLKTALDEALKTLHEGYWVRLDKVSDYHRLEIHTHNRSCNVGNQCNYIDDDYLVIGISHPDNDNRLHYDLTKQEIEAKIATTKQNAIKLESDIANYDQLLAQYTNLAERLNTFSNNMHWMTKKQFDIRNIARYL